MDTQSSVYAAQYFTATIYELQTALANDSHKNIIIDSLQYLVNDKRIELNAFVIMSNHIHLTCLPKASMADITGFYSITGRTCEEL